MGQNHALTLRARREQHGARDIAMPMQSVEMGARMNCIVS